MDYSEWMQRFPQFVAVSEGSFNMTKTEAVLEMGSEPKWGPAYELALGYLIAHLAALAERSEAGDHTTVQPMRSKDVDGVEIEYAVSKEMQNNLNSYLSTTYGQRYLRWRRMVFAGPRVI